MLGLVQRGCHCRVEDSPEKFCVFSDIRLCVHNAGGVDTDDC